MCLAWVCVCVRVTGAGLCLGAGRGALGVCMQYYGRAGGRGFSLLPFIGFNIPESARLLSLSWLGRQAGQACRPPPLFLIPASLGMRRQEKAPLDHLGFRGWGQARGQFFSMVGEGPPNSLLKGNAIRL